MDLGCLDLGCVSVSDKRSTEKKNPSVRRSEKKEDNATDPISASSKNKFSKETGQYALNKFTSHIKKPPHRKTSPINWFPRKKVDSYLKRKIKMLQELDGLNLTLDETLGDSNPHYSRVLREKIAAREAAHKAMEARKAALVEASWCKILRAARIQSKEAEAQLLKAEKTAVEALEAATAVGVRMYDIPNGPEKPNYQIETSLATHTITASFETAFEVDKEVAAAVKTALIRLANCHSFNEDEFKEVLRKISQNPDTGENSEELSEFSPSECESESRERKNRRRRRSFEKLNRTKIIDMMVERLKFLQEDEISSLATIVATCGLNAALAEIESSKMNAILGHPSAPALNVSRRVSLNSGNYSTNWLARRKQAESEIPSLDKFLVKHMTKLERVVEEAKNSKTNESNAKAINSGNTVRTSSENAQDLGSILVKHSSKLEREIEKAKKIDSVKEVEMDRNKLHSDITPLDAIPDLGSMLIKHTSKLEKEIEEFKRKSGVKSSHFNHTKEVAEVPSLEKFLVKHVSRLEREIQEAKNRRNNDARDRCAVTTLKKHSGSSASDAAPHTENLRFVSDAEPKEKENIDDINKNITRKKAKQKKETKENDNTLDKILVKPIHKLEREKMQALTAQSDDRDHRHQKKQAENDGANYESLDKVLVKHVSRLEKEKMRFNSNEEEVKMNKCESKTRSQTNEGGGLDQISVKHKSRLELDKMVASQQPEYEIKQSESRREARERELQEAWGGLSLGNSIKPHLSKLEREKAAWIKAEEQERRRAVKEM